MAGDWSEDQNDAIVADYFPMLVNDIAGRPYSKVEHSIANCRLRAGSRVSMPCVTIATTNASTNGRNGSTRPTC